MTTCEQYILDYAATENIFGAEDIICSWQRKEISRQSLNAMLARLVKVGKLQRISRGRYAINSRKAFKPELQQSTVDLYKSIKEHYPYTSVCVYEGRWLVQFMHHVSSNNSIYIEVERDAAEFVFDWLRAKGMEAYYRPDGEFIYRYVDLGKGAVIVKVLTSQSPLQEEDDVKIPTLEKLLVDMYCDKDFMYLQGSEYYHVVNAAQDEYELCMPTLLRYASRRNVKDKIEKIIEDAKNDID